MTAAKRPFLRSSADLPHPVTLLAAVAALGLASACAGGAASGKDVTHKPDGKADLVAEASPALGEYLTKALTGKDVGGKTIRTAKLVAAKPFDEGHVNETWFLEADVDGEPARFALKIFPTPEGASVNAAQFQTARAKGWRVPLEYARGAVQPYTERHGLLMEFIDGGSLAKHVKAHVAKGGDIQAIAALYGKMGMTLGRLHEANRKSASGLRTAGAELRGLAARCAEEKWCDAAAKARLDGLAGHMDQGPVTFIHGDLYEQQIIMNDEGGLAAFIDLDLAKYDDPAADVGGMLAHILYINTTARQATQGVADASVAEAKATAERFLADYRKGAWLKDDEWAAFTTRAKGHVYLRVASLLSRYKGNPHAKPLVDVLEARKGELIARDPFEGLTL